MSLPTSLRPGKDLMSKRVVQEPRVINYITEALTKTKNDYSIGNCEWKNGTRSDIVLEPKCSTLDLPPIILEIQHTANKKFMRMGIDYCLQAISRYDVEPILLIICVDTVHQDIRDDVADSRLPGVSSYFCKLWASDCFIICQDSIKQNITTPLNPLIALGLFLANHCLSILDNPYTGDPTIQYLYIVTLHHHQIDFQDITSLPLKLIDTQITEYDRLITLANTLNQPLLVEAVNEAKSRIYATKRKYDDLLTAESLSNTAAVVESTTDKNKESYEAAMNFVAELKQERADQGKRMDWVACLEE